MSDTEFHVPEGTAEQAKESMVDALAADAKAPEVPVEYPDGCPEFYPLLESPYDRRATAINRYADLQDYLKAHPDLQKDTEKAAEQVQDGTEPEVDLRAAAGSYEMVTVMYKFMESVAVDPDAFAAWPQRYDIDVFMQAWSAYQGATQPGEAPSSSS